MPSDIEVKLSYGNETKEAVGNAVFTAHPLKNKIKAEY